MNIIKLAVGIAVVFALLMAIAIWQPAPAPAQAQAPEAAPAAVAVPDEATKIRALKRAYELNGNSMVGDGRMIDLTGEDLGANPVRTERVIPLTEPDALNELDRQASIVAQAETTPVSRPDVCKRHGLRKVVYGDRWRCRK